MTRIRVRGIYATALTHLLSNEFSVVGASDAIDRRFDASFSVEDHEVAIVPTDDDQGVGVVGPSDSADAVRDRLAQVGIDSLSWADEAPRGTIFDATVTDERGRGAVVDLGPREGFLPYDATDAHVSAGDSFRVQVHKPAAPWVDRRPEVGVTIRAFGGLVDLVRGADGSRADFSGDRASELVRTTAVLPTDVPDGWGVRWQPMAAEAGLDDLDDALSTTVELASTLEDLLDDADDSYPIPGPESTHWVWFGRESRFALDDSRRSVTATMPGHHRIKAGDDPASPAVDFAERLCAPSGAFPMNAVADTFGPSVGDTIRINHGKPEGRRFALGRGEVTDRDGDTVTVRREMTAGGEYDALGVARDSGDVAITKLSEGRWWYPTVYRDADGGIKGTYVNVCTPVELFPRAATYVDLHVDVVRHADGAVERVDDPELEAAVEAGHVSEALAAKAREVATSVERALA